MAAADLTAQRLREALDYDPSTGALRWRIPGARRRKPGDVAGCLCKTRGYRLVRLDGSLYLAHRLAWLYVHGEWPPQLIDHINGDPADNRLSNLRLASARMNVENQRAGIGRSGILGVTCQDGRWRAQITTRDRNYYLGSFDSAAEAHQAYLQAKRTLHAGCTI